MTAPCRFLTLASLTLLTAGPIVVGQDKKTAPERELVATGSATVHARPDAARVTFVVVTDSPNKARDENDKQVKTIKEKLAALAFTGVEIQTVPYALGTIVIDDPAAPMGVPPPRLQHAQTGFVILIQEKNADKLREMVTKLADAATENGAAPTDANDPLAALGGFIGRRKQTHAGPQIEWLRKNSDEARREAIKKAVSEAKLNAEAALPDAKLTLTRIDVIKVRESASPRFSSLRAESPPIEIDVPITINVTVTYCFE